MRQPWLLPNKATASEMGLSHDFFWTGHTLRRSLCFNIWIMERQSLNWSIRFLWRGATNLKGGHCMIFAEGCQAWKGGLSMIFAKGGQVWKGGLCTFIFAEGGQVWKGGLCTFIFAKGGQVSKKVAIVIRFSHKVAKSVERWPILCDFFERWPSQ